MYCRGAGFWGALGAIVVGIFAAHGWFLILGVIQSLMLWQSGQGSVRALATAFVTPPLWYSVLWGGGVSLPMYYLWDRMGKRQRLLCLFLLGAAATCVSAVVLGFQHGFAQLFSPAFLIMSVLYMASCILITGGGLWYLKTRLLGESA